MTRREATVILLAALLLAISLLLFLGAMNEASACGSERWPVKTLTDRDANQVDHEPMPVSVRFMAAMISPPFLGPLTSRIFPFETRTYRIKARVFGVKLEPDGDIHVAIKARRRQMMTESPAPECTHGAAKADRRHMQISRRWLLKRFHPTTRWRDVDVAIIVTGVGFWDLPHGVRGAARNGVELHPILAVRAG